MQGAPQNPASQSNNNNASHQPQATTASASQPQPQAKITLTSTPSPVVPSQLQEPSIVSMIQNSPEKKKRSRFLLKSWRHKSKGYKRS